MRSELWSEVKIGMKLDDTGSNYGVLIICLSKLSRAVRPHSFPSGKVRKRAQLLKFNLSRLTQLVETSAIKKTPGLNYFLFSELSGQASMPSLRRFGAFAAAAEKTESRAGGGVEASPASGSDVSRRRNDRRFNNNVRKTGNVKEYRDLAVVQCFGCKRFGHYRDNCPDKKDRKD